MNKKPYEELRADSTSKRGHKRNKIHLNVFKRQKREQCIWNELGIWEMRSATLGTAMYFTYSKNIFKSYKGFSRLFTFCDFFFFFLIWKILGKHCLSGDASEGGFLFKTAERSAFSRLVQERGPELEMNCQWHAHFH